MQDIKILVATHKPYRMPEDSIYYPLQVGANRRTAFGLPGDNTGIHISNKNPNYCELTGLYWMWKNCPSEYLGLTHYRRHFARTGIGDKWKRVVKRGDVESLLQQTDVILPSKRNYHIETIYDQHAHAHHAVDLDVARHVLEEKYPAYLAAFDDCMKSTKGHKFNMFIMKRSLSDAYCEWLFDVLFEMEKQLDISNYSTDDARVFGFVAECLLDVWIITNKISYLEIPVLYMEKQNWLIKGGNFLLRKYGLKKQAANCDLIPPHPLHHRAIPR